MTGLLLTAFTVIVNSVLPEAVVVVLGVAVWLSGETDELPACDCVLVEALL